MTRLRKRARGLVVAAAAAGAILAVHPAAANEDPEARIERLLDELAEPDRGDWQRVEGEIIRHWSRSGSDAMDLLLRRGREAIEIGHWVAAIEHLTALTDHAPDFAEGWFARATAFHLMGEPALALVDLEQVLAIEPRHFGALLRLGAVFEEIGQHGLAMEAQRAAETVNPHRPEITEALRRLRSRAGEAEL